MTRKLLVFAANAARVRMCPGASSPPPRPRLGRLFGARVLLARLDFGLKEAICATLRRFLSF